MGVGVGVGVCVGFGIGVWVGVGVGVVLCCVVLNHITRGFRRSSWLLSSGESCGSRLRLRSWSALILVQGVRHQRAKVTVLTGRRDYLRACAAGPRDTICGAVVELDMILRSDPSR